MSATNFNTENRTYRQLLGNGLTYRVPRFQRDYSWTEGEWEDLWADILGALPADGEPAHYMGYLVLETRDNRNFDVIDGQQRLTTLSLIVLAGMRLLKRSAEEGRDPTESQARLEQLRASYIGSLDPVTLTSRSKLTLNRNNDGYYRDYLVTLAGSLPQRGFPASVHAMRKAFEWFEARIRQYIKSRDDQGRAIAEFIENMSDKLFFTVITVSDEVNAYKVFETLNARGVRLSATDLLKNYLFSVLAREAHPEHELGELERKWDNMVGRLGSETFPDFLRMHWNSRERFARKTELFKVIRGRIKSRESVFELLRKMDEDIDTYLALTQPEGSQWIQKWRQHAQELRMFSVRQPYPMLMAARRSLGDQDFGRLLEATVTLAFRYNVIGAQPPGEQERVYHNVAIKIADGVDLDFNQIIDALRPVYVGDDSFGSAFADKTIKTTASRNAKIVRYILCRLEKQMSGKDFEIDSPAYGIEHVLPQNPEAGWDEFGDRDLEIFTYRLGNMVMLEAGKNRALGNKPYQEKRAVLRESEFTLTSGLAESNDEWTPGRLEARQKKMAKLAKTVWRIGRLS